MSKTVQTAYEQSIQAAKTLMQSVAQEQTALEREQQEKRMRQKAFRVAFDMLEGLQPADNTVDYWTLVTGKMQTVYKENEDNMLCRMLLKTIFDYLEATAKTEQEVKQ